MNADNFSENLIRNHFYNTTQPRCLWAEKIPALATAVYYARLVNLIVRSSRVARRGRYTSKQWCWDSHFVMQILESVGGTVHISGLKKMARHPGPVVFIANHMSMLDTFLLPGLVLPFRRVTFVIKEGLLDYPAFGWIMKAVKPIAVKRQNPRKDLKTVLSEGQRFLAENCSVIIFPQATRSARFDPATFNTLGVKLARKAGVPVVPVALKTDFQQNGKYIKEMGPVNPQKPVYIQFGDPMVVQGNGQATHRAIVDFIEAKLAAWALPTDGANSVAG